MAILITGGSRGIGRSIAERFASPGEKVFINYARDDAAAEEAAAAVRQRGGDAVLVKGDVGSSQGAFAVLAEVARHTERLDQLVHGAVRVYPSALVKADPCEFERALSINGTALLYLVQAANSLLRRGSSVFFLSSRGAKQTLPRYGAIGAPKALAEALARYLAVELAPRGIRVHVVSPGFVLTDAVRELVPQAAERAEALSAANPLGRNVTGEDVAAAVHFLASSGAAMITGAELVIDGGAFLKLRM